MLRRGKSSLALDALNLEPLGAATLSPSEAQKVTEWIADPNPDDDPDKTPVLF